ncbi:immunity 41 family protein [Gallibacterium salpingitidis]|uniref:Imm41 family immunity protein n=1 Tax=Gallibacterium salpingitidis TaxID=505341 RepID=UPI00266FD212|nr:Imm41 family immunity protein [Gallibacterium salpingitidis]WKS98709.1 immunity 41 family protein [Gallibacterium salpingitidis]
MDKLYDFYRNITYFEQYDENSFIGRWLDYSEWNDVEYWKLEKSLLEISNMYRIEKNVSTDILMGIMRIIQLLIVPNWNDFKPSNIKNGSIYDRYERFKYIISMLFSESNIETRGFFYDPPDCVI